MKTIALKPVKATKKLLEKLEKRGLITTLKFPKACVKSASSRGKVEQLYETAPRFGAQKLICVGKRDLEIRMSVHGDKEELLMINTTGMQFKPLFLIIALDKIGVFRKKIRNGTLGARDVMAVELRYNDPATSIFTMNGGVPHCEVTLPGRGQHPVFFVTEPVKLNYAEIPTPGMKLELKCSC
jgi:hypothetical protein